MHTTAFNNLKTFVEKYVKKQGLQVLDVGAMVVRDQDKSVGSVRELFRKHEYTGLDIAPGKNVDVVYDGEKFPFDDNVFDVIISSSCFEHDQMFWNTFLEMVRTLKPSGLIYLNAPSAGHVHRFPVDCWRFYPDAWKGLAKWGKVTLLEQYIDQNCYWKNNVGIFQK